MARNNFLTTPIPDALSHSLANQLAVASQPLADIAASLYKTQEVISSIARKPETIALANALISYNERWDNMLSSLRTPEWLEQINVFQNRLNNILSPSLSAMSNWMVDHRQEIATANQAMVAVIEQYAKFSNAISSQLPRIAELLQPMSPISDWLNDFDVSAIEFTDDGLVFNGKEFTQEDIAIELEQELSVYEQYKEEKSLKDRFDDFKNKIWLLLLIINLIWSLPDMQERTEWFVDNVPKLFELFESDNSSSELFAYTVVENAPLRDAPNANGAILKRIPIETKLNVLSDKPRWFEVEFITNDGTEIIGWVSKRSVEIDE